MESQTSPEVKPKRGPKFKPESERKIPFNTRFSPAVAEILATLKKGKVTEFIESAIIQKYNRERRGNKQSL